MTEQEYKEQSERVKLYESKNNQIEFLEAEKIRISIGIVFLECEYEYKILFKHRSEDFVERLKEHICNFYESEIEDIKKSLEEI